jgi:hypothetical protein
MKSLAQSILFLFILIPFLGASQNDSTVVQQRELILKYPVSSVFGDAFANSMGFSGGLEVVGKKGWSISQELGYVFKTSREAIMLGGGRVKRLNGFRATTEIRKYMFKRNLSPSNGLFISSEIDNLFTQSELANKPFTELEFGYKSTISLNVGTKVFWNKNKEGCLTLDFMIGPAFIIGDTPYLDLSAPVGWLNADLKLGYILGR